MRKQLESYIRNNVRPRYEWRSELNNYLYLLLTDAFIVNSVIVCLLWACLRFFGCGWITGNDFQVINLTGNSLPILKQLSLPKVFKKKIIPPHSKNSIQCLHLTPTASKITSWKGLESFVNRLNSKLLKSLCIRKLFGDILRQLM